MDGKVAAVFEGCSEPARTSLLELRALILKTAVNTGVGPLEETLKWGQVSYLTSKSRSGTTIRIDQDSQSGAVALYVHCQTDLVSRYRTLYPEAFRYQGDRAVLLNDTVDQAALEHVIALALTYHWAKTSR